jgi:hypothetical protein
MHVENLPASAGFRHIKRALNAGESVPRFPSLFEQLTACTSGGVVVDAPEADALSEEYDDEE